LPLQRARPRARLAEPAEIAPIAARTCDAVRRLLPRIRRVAYTEKPGAEVAPSMWRCYSRSGYDSMQISS